MKTKTYKIYSIKKNEFKEKLTFMCLSNPGTTTIKVKNKN